MFVGRPSKIHPSSSTVQIKFLCPTKPARRPRSIRFGIVLILSLVNPACSSQSVESPYEPPEMLSPNAIGCLLCFSLTAPIENRPHKTFSQCPSWLRKQSPIDVARPSRTSISPRGGSPHGPLIRLYQVRDSTESSIRRADRFPLRHPGRPQGPAPMLAPFNNPGEDRPMAKSLNRVDLLGYLGDDINIKEFHDGTSVGDFRRDRLQRQERIRGVDGAHGMACGGDLGCRFGVRGTGQWCPWAFDRAASDLLVEGRGCARRTFCNRIGRPCWSGSRWSRRCCWCRTRRR